MSDWTKSVFLNSPLSESLVKRVLDTLDEVGVGANACLQEDATLEIGHKTTDAMAVNEVVAACIQRTRVVKDTYTNKMRYSE